MTLNELYKETDEKKIIEKCETLYMQGLNMRHKYEPYWAMCERFYKGTNINVDYITSIGRGILPDINKTGYVHIENSIKPLVKKAMAIICDRMSTVTVIPATEEDEDVYAANISAEFLKSREETDDEITVRRNELTSLLVYGECARFTRYNSTKISDDGSSGDIETFSLDPSEYVRSVTKNNSDQPEWVITNEVYDIDTLKELYPDKTIKPNNVYVTQYGNNKLEEFENQKDRALVKRLYIRGNSANKNGRYYAWVGDVLLTQGELPDGVFPFVIMKWLYVPGKAYPEGFVEPLIKPQITINDNLLKLKRLSEKKSNPPILMPLNSELRQETLKSGVDIYRYKEVLDKPEFLQFPQDMQECYNLISFAREEMMEIAGLRETSLGRQPREATATQIAMLKESDNNGIGYFKNQFEKSYALICYIKLKLAQKYFKQERMIKTIGVDSKPTVKYFYGSDIKGACDVIIRPIPYMSEAMRQNQLQQLIANGAFGPYNGIEHCRAMMSLIMNSGLNDARDIVDSILGSDMTYENLQELSSAITARKTTLEIENLSLNEMNTQVQAMQLKSQYQQLAMNELAAQGGMQQPQDIMVGDDAGIDDSNLIQGEQPINENEYTGESF